LAECEERLKSLPENQRIVRAAVQLQRAGHLQLLQRFPEAIAAADEALKSGGPECRFNPHALKLQSQIHEKLDEHAKTEQVCRRIIAEHPRSLESKYAHQTLLSCLKSQNKWDEAIQDGQKYFMAFPVDQEAHDDLYGLLDTLMQDEHDFKRAARLAEWMMAAFPPERRTTELVKIHGGCSEYVLKDFAKAQKQYALLAEQYTDELSAEDMRGALARIKLKTEGKFPKEPAESEAGPAGAFAKFLRCIRTRDAKAIGETVPKEEAAGYKDLIDGADDMITGITFSDFVLKKPEFDEKAVSADLVIDYYEAAADAPQPLKQKAIKEDGIWKIQWRNPKEEAQPAPPGN